MASTKLSIVPPAPFASMPGAELLQNWVDELKTTCANPNEGEWRLVGRAVILVVDDVSRGLALTKLAAEAAGFGFLNVDAEDVMDLAPRSTFRKMAPALMYLEPGAWIAKPEDDLDAESAQKRIAFQRWLIKWINEFDVAHPIVLVTANRELGDMSGLIDDPGVFDRYFALPPIPVLQQGEAFINELGREKCGATMLDMPGKLGRLLDGEFSEKRREMLLLYLRRLNRRENRLIEFLDLMHVSTHGFAEEGTVPPNSDEARRHVAMHEAGHAAMAILDSNGKNMPEYCSIVPGAYFKGIVAESISYHQSLEDRTTYATFRHRIRISLAGRAGEELAFGPENVSSGASGDLESAWKSTNRAFARWGFAPDMTTPESSASNVAVVVGDPTPSEAAYLEGLTRKFLTDEYRVVLKQLADHRPLVEAIADRLMWDPIVDQGELLELSQQHLIPITTPVLTQRSKKMSPTTRRKSHGSTNS
jgi:hypothetical protein